MHCNTGKEPKGIFKVDVVAKSPYCMFDNMAVFQTGITIRYLENEVMRESIFQSMRLVWSQPRPRLEFSFVRNEKEPGGRLSLRCPPPRAIANGACK
jgi:hypothetical protein